MLYIRDYFFSLLRLVYLRTSVALDMMPDNPGQNKKTIGSHVISAAEITITLLARALKLLFMKIIK